MEHLVKIPQIAMPGWLLGLVLSLAMLSLSASARAPLEQRQFDSNPWLSLNSDFADPFVLKDETTYIALATGANGQHIQVASSVNLDTWKRLPDALPQLPPWASRDAHLTWAPSVLKRGSNYVLYYTARDRTSGYQCISRAVSAKPAGPYLDASVRPFICQTSGADSLCGSIDPSPFLDRDGTPYLYWKSDENSNMCRTPPRVWVQRLSDDGENLIGAPSSILKLDQAWEATIVEGPSMLASSGSYLLFYSANWFASSRYAIGYAKCETAVGPCSKVTKVAPWVKSKGNVLGPGGQEFFHDGNGRTFMAYHAWAAPTASYARGGVRSLRIELLAFADGAPTTVNLH